MNLSIVILLNVAGSRPAAGVAGRLFFASDTLKVYRDNGAAWDDVTPAAALASQILVGALEARPAASTAGRLYFSTDAPPKVFRDDGADWIDVSPIPAGVILDGGGAKTEGHVLVFDADGKVIDGGEPPSQGSGLMSMGFLIGWNSGASTGPDLAGHRYIGVDCAPVLLHAGCGGAPVGGTMSITVSLVHEGVTTPITVDPLDIAEGEFSASTEAFAEGIAFQAGDYLKVDASQSAGTPGTNVFIELLVSKS